MEWLREAKDNPQYSNISFDEIYFTNDMLATLIEVFSSLSKRHQTYWDRLNIEFCQNVDMIATTALLMDCVKHLFVASDGEEDEKLVVRLAAALRVNLSLKSLWLLLPLTLESVTALGEALAINDALNKLSLSGSKWINILDVDDDDGNETDTYATDTDDEYVDSSRYMSSDEEEVAAANVQILRYTDPQLAELALRSANALADGLRYNTSLRTVDLSSCELPDAALAVILQSLVGHPTLENLDISRNRAGPDTIRALADLVGHPESALTTLDLREQRKAVKHKKTKAKKATPRRRGKMDKQYEDDEEEEEDDFDETARDGLDLIPLSQALYNNEMVQVLRLSHNQLTDDQIAELVRNLQGNESLVELDLQFNSITTRGVKVITKGLSELPALKVLLLGGNDFGKEGNKMLAQLEDDDDSVCTIMETGGGKKGGGDDDEDTFHSARSSNTRNKNSTTTNSKPSSSRTGGMSGFMGGLTGITER